MGSFSQQLRHYTSIFYIIITIERSKIWREAFSTAQLAPLVIYLEIALRTLIYMYIKSGAVSVCDVHFGYSFDNNYCHYCTFFICVQRVVHQRVLPALAREFRNHKMVPFVLPLVLLIAEDCSIQDHETLIMPILIPALGIQNPVQVSCHIIVYNIHDVVLL